jgi:hypothetical protein
MSSDQRPGKVRVFSSGTTPESGARRREDNADHRLRPAAAPLEPADHRADKRTGLVNFGLAVLFLLGCAGGGALLARLGLIPGGGL